MSDREILFKAKRLDNGEWVEGLYFRDCQSNYLQCKINSEEYRAYEIDRKTLSQYTGIECNGVKLFENDIVKACWNDGVEDNTTIGEVIWSDESRKNIDAICGGHTEGCWIWDDKKRRDSMFYPWMKFEILGNRFDSPELMEKVK